MFHFNLGWGGNCNGYYAINAVLNYNSFGAIFNIHPQGETTSYVINVSSNNEEFGTVSGGGTFNYGELCTVSAMPDEWFIFGCWTENGNVVSYDSDYSFVVTSDRNLTAHFASLEGNIIFNDDKVRTICVSNWDTNGDGALSYDEAAAVEHIGTVFSGNMEIISFDELWRFNNLVSIDNDAFSGCTNLNTLSLPNSITSIESYAFYGCNSLNSITIPNSVDSISNYAFYGCNGLTSITVHAETPPVIYSSTFDYCLKSIPVYVPCGSLEAYQSAAYWNTFTNIQENCSEQTVTLSQDWNWFSTYIDITNPIEMLQTLEAALSENGIQIKNSDISTEYDAEWGWFGDLDEVGFTNEEMLMIKAAAACSVQLQGPPANPANHPITINPGWNWIGYPCAEETTLNQAFSNFTPEAGDQIKNSEGSSEYDSEWGWFGDVETLVPGHGFMYYSSSAVAKTLIFQVGRK